jgi:nucleoside recognition membrane protein YjiH
MATYESLTQTEKDAIALVDIHYRGRVSSLAKLMDQDSEEMAEYITSVVKPIIATLTVGEVIPNATSLAGAQDLTVAQWEGMQTFLESQEATKTANIAVLTKAVGVNV